MARSTFERECPKCGQPMFHQKEDPDTGIVGGWLCADCEYDEDDYDDYSEENE